MSAAAAATALPTPVYFVTRRHYAKWRDIDQLSAQDIDRNPQRFRSGVDVWIAQSYLRLRKPLGCRGYAPAFSDRFVADALCIAHRDDLNQLGSRPLRGYVLGVRADRPPMLVCDQEITQNNLIPDSPQRHYLPHWPQPGMVPRDPARGNTIRKLGYLGRDSAAPAWFRDRAFHDALAELGVSFEIRTQAWHDYSDIDLLLAYRNELPTMLQHKPATKLCNAWLAGTPALLGDEPAYAALRRSDLDYLVVHQARDVLQAVRRLVADRELYVRMIDNGRQRATFYTNEAVTAGWIELLDGVARPAMQTWLAQGSSTMRRAQRALHGLNLLLAQKSAARRFRRQLAGERQAMMSP